MADKKINPAIGKIGNALRSVAEDHITTFAEDCFDEGRQKYQSDINTDHEESLQQLDKKLNRNLLAIEFDDDTGELNAIIGQDSTINSVSTDEDGNVIIEQNII